MSHHDRPVEFGRRDPAPRRGRGPWWWLAVLLLVAAGALAPPLPHEPWLLGGFAAGYLVAVLDRVLSRGNGRHR